MQYKIENNTLDSRRGKYNTVELIANPLRFKPKLLDSTNPRHAAVIDEVGKASLNKLSEHKYWKNEPIEWIEQYQSFYNELFSLNWIYDNDDRHSIAVNKYCCLTLVQYHNHMLIAYSRSTDMRNGYFSDRLLLHYLAHRITVDRPDCEVKMIEWHIAIPHVYLHSEGVARIITDEEAA